MEQLRARCTLLRDSVTPLLGIPGGYRADQRIADEVLKTAQSEMAVMEDPGDDVWLGAVEVEVVA